MSGRRWPKAATNELARFWLCQAREQPPSEQVGTSGEQEAQAAEAPSPYVADTASGSSRDSHVPEVAATEGATSVAAASSGALPAGWAERVCTYPSGRTVKSYVGPNGEKARSVKEIWRMVG